MYKPHHFKISTAQVGNKLLTKILSSKNHVLFFAENWNLKAETVSQVREAAKKSSHLNGRAIKA